ncbi:MAG TPA: 3-oxosteroid 1-dehydrogenase, partial [Cellvibrionales bacterium]|nr:3-oxosteroid 1-dehydrogenase [Cellvibrionales bacterium]
SDDNIPKGYFDTGLLTKAPSLHQLAEKLDIDAAQLVETVTQFNANAIRGVDPDFGRGESLHDRYYADAKVLPNPSLGPIEKGPFYAFKVEAGDLDTKGGIVCDEWGRVCDKDGAVISGLYGSGNTTAAVMGDTYPGAGATIGSAMTFAYIAAHHAIS